MTLTVKWESGLLCQLEAYKILGLGTALSQTPAKVTVQHKIRLQYITEPTVTSARWPHAAGARGLGLESETKPELRSSGKPEVRNSCTWKYSRFCAFGSNFKSSYETILMWGHCGHHQVKLPVAGPAPPATFQI